MIGSARPSDGAMRTRNRNAQYMQVHVAWHALCGTTRTVNKTLVARQLAVTSRRRRGIRVWGLKWPQAQAQAQA
jgi:hypothetical protein